MMTQVNYGHQLKYAKEYRVFVYDKYTQRVITNKT